MKNGYIRLLPAGDQIALDVPLLLRPGVPRGIPPGTAIVADLAAFESMVENFVARTTGTHELLIGFDGQEDSQAAGWISKLIATEDGLWAAILWTPAGSAEVTGEAFRFMNPTFSKLESLGAGRVRPVELSGAILTNRPTLDGLQPIPVLLQPAPPSVGTGLIANRLGLVKEAKLSSILDGIQILKGRALRAESAGTLETTLRNRAASLERELANTRAQLANAQAEVARAKREAQDAHVQVFRNRSTLRRF